MAAITVGILTVSDRCSRGEAVDSAGANLQELISSNSLFQGQVAQYRCVPDEPAKIKEVLVQWCDEDKLNLVLTTGGTGFGPRDLTPEAVKQVIDREAPGLTIRMMTESLRVTHLAMLSRPVCGSRGESLVVTLPGSKKGSEECLRFVAPAIPHAVHLLTGQTINVESTHKHLQAEGVKHTHSHGHGHHHHHHHHHHPHHTQHRQASGHCHHHGAETGESKADITQVSRRPRKSPYPLIPVSQATETVLSHAEVCPTEHLPTTKALGFVLAEDIFAKDPLPPFPASIKDGYAVVASDGAGLRPVGGGATAGCGPEEYKVKPGMCVRINTGAPVPPGADAVIQVEDTELIKESDDGTTELEIKILKAPGIGQDIRPVACDIQVNEKVLSVGTLLGPAEMGLLATVGVTKVAVYSKPTVAVLSTGNELQEPGETLKEGHIRDCNKTTLVSLLRQNNIPVVDAGIAKDDTGSLLSALREALSQADVLVTSGGVSMGERDILRPVLMSDFGAKIHFAQVFMKPGKPTTFATCQYKDKKKLILGLPGNPVSAVVTSNLYLLPLCRKMSGRQSYQNTCIRTKLATTIHLDPRPEYHRVTLCWEPGTDYPTAHSTGNQLSSRLLSLASAQALLRLPPRSEELMTLPEGTVVDALLLGLH